MPKLNPCWICYVSPPDPLFRVQAHSLHASVSPYANEDNTINLPKPTWNTVLMVEVLQPP